MKTFYFTEEQRTLITTLGQTQKMVGTCVTPGVHDSLLRKVTEGRIKGIKSLAGQGKCY